MRQADIVRNTKETQISVGLNIDGRGVYEGTSGAGFLDHMLELFARHGHFDLKLQCAGDAHVDYHHSAEDVGIVMGRAFAQALGDMRGIIRYGSALLPMDEALVMVALDISGRFHLAFDVAFPTEKIGAFDTELVREFLSGFARALGLTLHVRLISGQNSHHISEAVFKGLARALSSAAAIDPERALEIPSTKGTLT